MASLSDLFGAGDAGGGVTTVSEPLPTFGVWTNYANNQYSQGTYSSNGQLLAGGYVYTGSEGWDKYSSQSRTDGSIGSNAWNSTFSFQSTYWNQSEGHLRLNFATNSMGYANLIKQFTNNMTSWSRFGTIIGPAGFRQKISLYASGTTLRAYRRGGYQIDNFVLQNNLQFNNNNAPGGSSYGMISYNSRINQLVYIFGDGSSYRLHSWSNPNINLNRVDYLAGDLRKYVEDAYAGVNGASYFYNDFTWSTTNSTSYTESQYHNRIVLGDNGKIGLMRMTPSTQTVSAWIEPNPNGTSLLTTPQQVIVRNLTTSYGVEQGSYYGAKTMMNWDNSVVGCFSAYYYYGSGINMHYINTADPSKQSYYQEADTNWGFSVYPLGKSSFGLRSAGNNGDTSAGLYSIIHTPSQELYQGVSASGSSVSNGSATYSYGMYWSVDYGYTSTNYPIITSMANWSYTGAGA